MHMKIDANKLNADGSFGYDVNAAERIDITLKKLGVEYIDLWILRCNQHAASLQDEAMRGMKVSTSGKLHETVQRWKIWHASIYW